MVAEAAHLPVTPEHLTEAPYVGVLFVAFSSAALAGSAAVLLRDTAGRYAGTGPHRPRDGHAHGHGHRQGLTAAMHPLVTR